MRYWKGKCTVWVGEEKPHWTSNLKLAKSCAKSKFWFHIWKECGMWRTGVVNDLCLYTKRHFVKGPKRHQANLALNAVLKVCMRRSLLNACSSLAMTLVYRLRNISNLRKKKKSTVLMAFVQYIFKLASLLWLWAWNCFIKEFFARNQSQIYLPLVKLALSLKRENLPTSALHSDRLFFSPYFTKYLD